MATVATAQTAWQRVRSRMKSVLLAAMMASVLVVGFAAPAVPVVHAEEEWCSVC